MGKRPEYDVKLIGKKLKLLRKAKGLTVEDVRRYLCLGSVQAVYKYESGKGYPNVDTMFALMELYGADLCDVVAWPKCCGKRLARLGQGKGVDLWYFGQEPGVTWTLSCFGFQGYATRHLESYCVLGGWAS